MKIPSLNAGRQAFTLMELMIVVAILGLLAAILMPAIQSVRYSMWQSACGFNISKCTQAGMVFAKENQRKIVPLYIPTAYGTNGLFSAAAPQVISSNPPIVCWFDLLLPYIENRAVFSCPQLRQPAVNGYGGVRSATDKLGIGINLVQTKFYQSKDPLPYVFTSISSIVSSDQQVWFCDSANVSETTPFASRVESPGSAGGYFGQGTKSDKVIPRHRGKVNFGFFDGHVKILNPERINYKNGVVSADFEGCL